MRSLILCVAAFLSFAAPAAAQINITIDTSLADRTLGVLCTGQPIDDAAIRAEPIVQAQIAHNSGIHPPATMDAYIEALRGASACRAPENDVFGVAAILAAPDVFRSKVNAIHERQTELAASIARRLTPFLPAGETFTGQVTLAVPYFSCGGFARDGYFFVDIACLDPDISRDMLALELLMTHETFHIMQERWFYTPPNFRAPRTRHDALLNIFTYLLVEGSAMHVGPTRELQNGGGPYTRLARHLYLENERRIDANFQMLSVLIDDVSRSREPVVAFERAERMAFSGATFEEFGYHVGARMAADIEAVWGVPALACVLRLPAEQFVLAHDSIAQAAGPRLGAEAVSAARTLARGRPATQRYAACRP